MQPTNFIQYVQNFLEKQPHLHNTKNVMTVATPSIYLFFFFEKSVCDSNLVFLRFALTLMKKFHSKGQHDRPSRSPVVQLILYITCSVTKVA